MKREQEVIVVESEDEVIALAKGGPVVVAQTRSLEDREEDSLHAFYDAKPPEKIKDEAENMPLEKWTKCISQLRSNRRIKIDQNITAMGFLGMFPVAVQESK